MKGHHVAAGQPPLQLAHAHQPLPLHGVEQLVDQKRVAAGAALHKVAERRERIGRGGQPHGQQPLHLLGGEVGQGQLQRRRWLFRRPCQQRGQVTAWGQLIVTKQASAWIGSQGCWSSRNSSAP